MGHKTDLIPDYWDNGIKYDQNKKLQAMKRYRAAWRRHPIITTAFSIAVLFTVFFTFRSVAMMIYWANPDHHNVDIQAWMTPRYVMQSWHLNDDVMYQALQDDHLPGRRLTLGEIAAQQGITMPELKARIIAAATTFRDSQK